MSWALGVDLGTTYTAAAAAKDGKAEMIGLGDRSEVIPSVLALLSDGTVVVGDEAERRVASEPDRVAREFKRRIGDPAPILLGGTPLGAEALQGDLLRHVLRRATELEGSAPAHVTVTHPANWGPYKRDLLTETIRAAGLTAAHVTTLTEPEAAAAHYASEQRVEPGSTIAVYDLGGGTFDAAILRRSDDGYDFVGEAGGIERLGGIDFDEALFAHVRGQLDESAVDMTDPAAAEAGWAALRRECVAAKEALSSTADTTVAVALPGLRADIRVTRAEFEDLIGPTISRSTDALRRSLESAGVEPAELHSVLLVGGSSRIPLVGRAVTEALGRPVAVDAHPKFAIAKGAALVARSQLAGDTLVTDSPDASTTTTSPLPMPGPAPVTSGSSGSSGSSRLPLLVGGAVIVLAVLASFFVFGGDDPGDDGADPGNASVSAGDADVDGGDAEDAGDEFDHLAELPVTDGLVVGFFADAGVESADGRSVDRWTDLVSGFSLEPAQAPPTLIADGLAGHDLIRFDEEATVLVGDGGAVLPTGNTERTVFVAGEHGTGCCGNFRELRGLGWGDPTTSGAAFFVGSTNSSCFAHNVAGVMSSLGDGGSACFGQLNAQLVIADTNLEGAGPLTVGARLGNGGLDLIFGGELTAKRPDAFLTDDQQVWIGGWPTPNEAVLNPLDVAVALVYDRALSDDEVDQVLAHLDEEYGSTG